MAEQRTYTLISPPTPAIDPPPGVIPTFDQPYTLLPYAELTIAGCIFTTTILVFARIWVKVQIAKKLLWEDYTCIIGWVGCHFHIPPYPHTGFVAYISNSLRTFKTCVTEGRQTSTKHCTYRQGTSDVLSAMAVLTRSRKLRSLDRR